MIRVLNKPGTLEWRHRDGGGTGDYVMILDIHSWSSPRLTIIYRKPSQDTIAGELYASLQLVSVTDSSRRPTMSSSRGTLSRAVRMRISDLHHDSSYRHGRQE